jgi:hypothetical protein
MAYTVDDLTELIRYHLVLSEKTDDRADANLAQLMRNIEEMLAAPHPEPVYWRACEAMPGCPASWSAPMGAGEAA